MANRCRSLNILFHFLRSELSVCGPQLVHLGDMARGTIASVGLKTPQVFLTEELSELPSHFHLVEYRYSGIARGLVTLLAAICRQVTRPI